jgi:hypothetical protein
MQGSPQTSGVTLSIEFLGDCQRVRISLNHCVKERIKGRDLIEVICR